MVPSVDKGLQNMTTTRLRSTGLAALAFSASLTVVGLTVATPASAEPANEISVIAHDNVERMTTVVRTGDLDLTKGKDLYRLQSRVRSASRAVCASVGSTSLDPDEVDCQRNAQLSAAPQIAALRNRAFSLAAAGLPTRIDTTLTVVARDSE
jgi:UrcA family protein